jgi:alkanesulfonate monooxygenase SsuD/methylene tetrahydromethanopterin reductase-like flavin-dependent oxidoreductase (luciferase family)
MRRARCSGPALRSPIRSDAASTGIQALPGAASGRTDSVHFSINIPNFGDFADGRVVATVATTAEAAGWDALFVWDHVVHDKQMRQGQPFGDPWMLLTAAALATSRLRLGTMVTPVARRRPEQLARQVATLDAISGGRVIFGAGLGGPIEDEFASFGDTADPVVLAGRLDEGLELLSRYWSGETVEHDGPHYRVRETALLPATIQRPRPPVWIAGYWPNHRPMRRAAKWDGAVPLFKSARHGQTPTPEEVRELADYIAQQRGDRANDPFDIVVGGVSEPTAAADQIRSMEEAGATWWDERQAQTNPDHYSAEAVLRRAEAGPPAFC